MQQINRPYEGVFVTIEGGDGSGKTTLAMRLAERLKHQGYRVMRTREPGGTPLSEQIRNIILNPGSKLEITPQAELLLYLAARAQHVEMTIKPALLRGDIVLCERFNDSTIAYQGCARHLGMSYVEQLCHLVAEDPDKTLFLDLDPALGMDRIERQRQEPIDRFEKEKLPFHYEVRQGYLHLADKYPGRITVIDATQPIEQIENIAINALENLLKIT